MRPFLIPKVCAYGKLSVLSLAWLTCCCAFIFDSAYLSVPPCSPGTCSGHSDSSRLTGCTCPSGAARGLWALVTCSPIIQTWPAIFKRLHNYAFCLWKNRFLNSKLSFPRETKCLLNLYRTVTSLTPCSEIGKTSFEWSPHIRALYCWPYNTLETV